MRTNADRFCPELRRRMTYAAGMPETLNKKQAYPCNDRPAVLSDRCTYVGSCEVYQRKIRALAIGLACGDVNDG